MFGLFGRASAPALRSIGADQAASCAAIHAPAFAHPWSAAEFERLLTAPEVVADGVFDSRGARLHGFVLSRRAADEAEILTIAMAESQRRAGLGGKLLAFHLAQLAARGVKALFLEVDEANAAARALYARFGFAEVGRRPAYYRTAEGGRSTALVLRRALA